MRPLRTTFIIGAASLALAGVAIAATEAKMHVMNVQLPDGSIEQVHYTGDVAPKILIVPAAHATSSSFFDAALGPDSPFAMMDRMSAQMEAQSQVMMREASTMTAQAQGGTPVTPAALATMPQGTYQYTTISTTNGGKNCIQSVQISSTGQNRQPRMINTSSGDCSPAATGSTPAANGAVPGAAPLKATSYEKKDAKPATEHTPSI